VIKLREQIQKHIIFFLFQGLLTIAICVATSHGATRAIRIVDDPEQRCCLPGKYHALIIAINIYQDSRIPELETPVHDALRLANTLEERYGFRIDYLLNTDAVYDNVVNALRRLVAETEPEDSVLIYFAGHGDLDPLFESSRWLPVDAELNNPRTYIDDTLVKKAIAAMKAKHVLVVSDSCYAGSLFRERDSALPTIDETFYRDLYSRKSRWGLTSGDITPVTDEGKNAHSVFADHLIESLENNDQPLLTVTELFDRIDPVIRKKTEQTPRCGPMQDTGDQGGQFVFIIAGQGDLLDKALVSRESKLNINTNVDGALILVDETVVGYTNLSNFEVPPGQHTVRIVADGYETYFELIKLEEGKLISLNVALKARAKSQSQVDAGSDRGLLYLNTQPENAVVVFKNAAVSYFPGVALVPGLYRLQVTAPGYEPVNLWINIYANRKKFLEVELKPEAAFNDQQLQAASTAYLSPNVKNSIGMEFNFISPGRYKIGSPEDDPDRFINEYRTEIHFQKGFYIQTTEVTVGHFREFVNATGYITDAERSGGAFVKADKKWRRIEAYHWDYPGFSQTDNHPVTCVSFNDIQMFIKWLNKKENKSHRLPTEEEWESACRAGTTTARYWGNSVNSACFYANIYDITGRRVNKMHWDRHFCDDGIARTAPVARYKPNNFGLYDMLGNVWEWCSDFYRHSSNEKIISQADSGSKYRVIRGGSWESSPAHARSAMRQGQLMSTANPYMGFRLILEH